MSDDLENEHGMMTDEERNARVADLLDECRPFADELIAQYCIYLHQFDGDKAMAFHALTMYLLVGVETAKYDEKAMLALVAFMTRRLSNMMPLLARSFN